MTYRDDTEAAIARADALQGEVDRLRAKVEQLERARDAPAVVDDARAASDSLVIRDHAQLIELVAEGFEQSRNARIAAVLFGVMLGIAGLGLAMVTWRMGAFVGAVGIVISVVGFSRYGRSDFDDLLDVVRHRPSELTSIAIEPSGIRLRAGHRAALCSTSHEDVLAAALQRYCPGSKLLHGASERLR